MIINRINRLRKKFNKLNIDGYIVPKNDEFFSEYAAKDRLKSIESEKHSLIKQIQSEVSKKDTKKNQSVKNVKT